MATCVGGGGGVGANKMHKGPTKQIPTHMHIHKPVNTGKHIHIHAYSQARTHTHTYTPSSTTRVSFSAQNDVRVGPQWKDFLGKCSSKLLRLLRLH